MPPLSPPLPPRQKNRDKYFSSDCHVKKIRAFWGKYYVKVGNFVNLKGRYHKNSGILIIFQENISQSPTPKFTKLLRLCNDCRCRVMKVRRSRLRSTQQRTASAQRSQLNKCVKCSRLQCDSRSMIAMDNSRHSLHTTRAHIPGRSPEKSAVCCRTTIKKTYIDSQPGAYLGRPL